MAPLDKLVNGRRKHRHAKFLFLGLFWDADYHAANIFSSPVGDKFFALAPKWGNESGRDDFARRFLAVIAALGVAMVLFAQEEMADKELEEASEDFMRDELGVNEITAPSIARS